VKKCECFLGIAPRQGCATVGFGLPGLKLLSPWLGFCTLDVASLDDDRLVANAESFE
jgi:hypothetical protein